MLGKMLYFVRGDWEIYRVAKKFQPDLLVCFMSPYAAQVSRLLGKPCVVVDDTEHAKLHDKFTYPYADTILTPSCFTRDLGVKHVRFNSFLELNYLHPNRFQPDPEIYQMLNLPEHDPYVVLRLVAWGGHHDVGHSGIGEEVQKALVDAVSKKYRVFISSEKPLPEFFEPYRINLPSHKIHHLLAYASLFIGESGTMAGESVVLGTPSVYVNSLPLMGYLEDAQSNGMLFHYPNDKQVLRKVNELLEINDLKSHFARKHQAHIKNKIDGSSFLVWFLENYPDSKEQMKNISEIEKRFDPITGTISSNL